MPKFAHSLTFFALLTAPLAGCGSPDKSGDKTEGARVVLHTTIATSSSFAKTFTSNFGWKVTLTKAAVAVGALYYFDGDPAVTLHEAPKPGVGERLAKLLGFGIAYAHPGHYQAGDAMGEMLSASSYDLLSGAAAKLADGDGVTGSFRSARFVFASMAPSGPAASELAGHAAFAEGSAEKADGTTPAPIHFRIFADYTDIAKEAVDANVDGCIFAPADVEGDGTVALSVSPNVWFNLVDFTDVAAGSAAAPTVIASTDKARIGFVVGLTQLSAYGFAFAP